MRTALAGALVVWAVLTAVPTVRACSEAEVASDLDAVAASLDERPRSALARMDGLGLQLLAARSYLRAGDTLRSRWSWTEQEIAAYEQSEEYKALRAEIAKVVQRFETLNPGHTLYVNLTARSVDQQLARWNDNASVARAAARIRRAALDQACGAEPLRRLLREWRPSVPPTLAAPGLSRHGQLRAFDFQVKQGDRIVAGPDSSNIERVWTRPRWTEKLREAVRTSSTALEGPLEQPNEPWHYVYEPERVSAAPRPGTE